MSSFTCTRTACLICISLYRELGVASASGENLQSTLNIRPYHWDVAGELTDRDEEITEQDEQSIQFDQKAGQGPAEEDEKDSGGEGGGSFELLRAGEEDYGLLDADDERQSDDEEDLVLLVGSR